MPNIINGDPLDSIVVFKTQQGLEIQADLRKVSPYSASFEIQNSTGAFRLSQAIDGFEIISQNQKIYTGRAVVRGVVDTGNSTVCEVTLDQSSFDVEMFAAENWRESLRNELQRAVMAPMKNLKLLPEFKVAVADLQMVLVDLRLWLEQVELRINSRPAPDRAKYEKEAIQTLQEPILEMAGHVLSEFERVSREVPPDTRPVHMSYMKRQIHPHVLCSPFIHRTYFKPLGYAGDYEMVNMMVRDPYEGASLYAKIINYIFLCTPPVEAHRNRIVYLKELLRNESLRALRKGHSARILNLGCGPAKEIQEFLATDDLCQHADFTLLDFNEETLSYTSRLLTEIKRRHSRTTPIQFVKKSVHQLLKEGSKGQTSAPQYDLVYCAGLFDYLSDTVCKKLTGIFHDLTIPGGTVVATNVAASHPSINWMEYVLDWNLIYRSARDFVRVAPEQAHADAMKVYAIGDGVNITLEVSKPENG